MWPSAKRSYAPVVLGNTPNPIHYREDGPTDFVTTLLCPSAVPPARRNSISVWKAGPAYCTPLIIGIGRTGYRRNRAELPIHFVVGTSGEIEGIGVRVSAAAQRYRPQPVDR